MMVSVSRCDIPMNELQRIFIIGPAGVGKSTCGALLANELGFDFVDQDAEFNKRIGEIAGYIRENGYGGYCRQNSDLFYALVGEQRSSAVYALSSGFLLYEDLEEKFAKHARDLLELGISILLLPSRSLEESVKIVVERVIARRPGVSAKKEESKMRERYARYLRFGDIRVFSADLPPAVAGKMKSEYLTFLARESGHLEEER